jgi:hypothetical protein
VSSPDNRFATMTDGEGHFEFSFPVAHPPDNTTLNGPISTEVFNPNENGPGSLNARKPGFLQDENSYAGISGREDKPLVIALTPEALIVGRVNLPSSEPAETIALELYSRQVNEGRAHWSLVTSTSTRSSGEFRFADLTAGDYKLLTRELMELDPVRFNPQGPAYGYPPVYFPNAGGFSSAETIHLSAGMVFRANISLLKREYHQVKLPVMNAPANGGLSLLVYAQGRGPGYALAYTPQEQIITGLLPDGTYTIEATFFGLNGVTGTANLTVNGTAVDGQPLVLSSSSSIHAEVKEEFTASEDKDPAQIHIITGRPRISSRFSYLSWRLEPADDFGQEHPIYESNPKPGEDESIIFENVPPGRYWLRINSSKGFVASASSGDVDLQHEPLVLAAGASISPIEVTVRDDWGELDGNIEGVTKLPPPEGTASGQARPSEPPAYVYLIPLPDSGGAYQEVWVSAEGKFNSGRVQPGAYLALAFERRQSQLEYNNAELMRDYEAKGQLVRVAGGQKVRLQLQTIPNSE